MLRRMLANYLVFVGLIANLAIAGAVLFWLSGKLISSDASLALRQQLFGPLDGVRITEVAPGVPSRVNPELKTLPPAVWHKLHTTEGFQRQKHAGPLSTN